MRTYAHGRRPAALLTLLSSPCAEESQRRTPPGEFDSADRALSGE